MYRIYIAEDDESIAAAIARGLSAWDFEVRTASDFKRIADEIAEYEPHLVLLDITLPFYNGFYWCSELRRNSRVPVVFISSAADNMNIVMAMNMGGDDFIAKPFDMSVLTAKIQALLRRTYDFAEQVGVIEHNGAKLNTPFSHHISRNGRINTAADKHSCPAVSACRHTACAFNIISSYKGIFFPNLNSHDDIGIMNIYL